MKPGTLFVLNVKKDEARGDINILTTLNNNHPLSNNWTHVPQLSPSLSLKKQVDEWVWSKKWPKMWEEFTHRYLLEFNDPDKLKYVNGILKRLSEGLDVAIGCDTLLEKYSHNRVVAKMVKDASSFEVVYGGDIRAKVDKCNISQNQDMQVSIFDI